MSAEPTIIYAARMLRDAYALRDRLAESGIKAVVLTDSSDAGAGRSGGMSVSARVAVDPSDAESARHIAQVFDRLSAERPTGLPAAGCKTAVAIPGWPECPECGTPRIARCPICETTGTHFTEADREFLDPSDFVADGAAGRPSADEAPTCGCGSAACSGVHSIDVTDRHPSRGTEPDLPPPTPKTEPRAVDGSREGGIRKTTWWPEVAEATVRSEEANGGAAPREDDHADGRPMRGADAADAHAARESPISPGTGAAPESEPLVLICPICDEPFVPRFARCCAWCGHRFPDGFDYEPETPAEESEASRRVVLMIAAMVGLLLFLLAYFAYVI